MPLRRRRPLAAVLLLVAASASAAAPPLLAWRRQSALDRELAMAVLAYDVPAARSALERGASARARLPEARILRTFQRRPPARWYEAYRDGHFFPMPLVVAAAGRGKLADGRTDMVSLLLKSGADPNARGPVRATPLHLAALSGNDAVAKLLLDAGADPGARTSGGLTPLHSAAGGMPKGRPGRGRAAETVRLLLARGAQIDATDEDDFTPLMEAAFSGNRTAFDVLLAAGARPRPPLPRRRGPLHCAAASGDVHMVRALLKRGTDADAADDGGRTPLLYLLESYKSGAAARRKHFDLEGTARSLLDAGARAGVRDEDGRTPERVAREAGEGALADRFAALARLEAGKHRPGG